MYNWLVAIASKFGEPYARKLATKSMRMAAGIVPTVPPQSLQREVMGLKFPSPVGLAAGFDKHGELYPSLYSLGFGFAEIGSVIPYPEKQRSRGLEAVVGILSRYPRPHPIPLGVSISMNRKTLPEKMADDYLTCLEGLWKYADYFAINLGVRAGPDLHMAEYATTFRKVLASVKDAQANLGRTSSVQRPLVVKIDRNRGDTTSLLTCVQEYAFDGLILSGDVGPGEDRHALAALERSVKMLDGCMPVISVGGIRTPQDAVDRLSAGAALIELYSSIVELGPLLPRRMNAWLS